MNLKIKTEAKLTEEDGTLELAIARAEVLARDRVEGLVGPRALVQVHQAVDEDASRLVQVEARHLQRRQVVAALAVDGLGSQK